MRTAWAVLTRNRRENNLSRMAANKTFLFACRKGWMKPPRPFFLKTQRQKRKEPLHLSSDRGFPEIQRTLPRQGCEGKRACAKMLLLESNFKRCSGPVLMFGWPSNVKLLTNVPAESSGTGHTYTSSGSQPPWGGARPESPPSRSQAALTLQGRTLGAVLSAGLRPSLKTRAHLPYPGRGQSDSAQKPELNAIFEGL